jgi:hypothetical protein
MVTNHRGTEDAENKERETREREEREGFYEFLD